ncbi:helix-turn-helix domain-containing protein [Streptosporangium sp. NPDC001559]|uniref:AlbA family DNA-binding domain-containing protein n=1 Tax=Streptosporangium sp. NPDC001559 TaxID=3366187 RepID=UPI0036EACB8C
MLYSPRRLETLLGAPVHQVTYQQIADLVGNADAREAEDLDYKRLYPSGEEGKDDIAIDIATFANHLGGLIIVGMAEVRDTPSAALGVALAGLENRIRSTVADRIHPMPRFGTRPVENPAEAGKGFLLIAIPPSTLAPHAVSIPSQEEKGLRWPRRHGADKVWLSESEIAAAYRRRVMAVTDQAGRVVELENNAVRTTATTSARSQFPLPLLAVTLVPDLPGDLLLDGEKVRAFEERTRQEIVMIGAQTPTFTSTSVAHRRLVAEAGGNSLFGVRAELYTDGAGTFTVHPTAIPPAGSDTFTVAVLDAEIVVRTASALRYLARHARDQAAVNGSALVRVTLVADTHLHPTLYSGPRPAGWPYDDIHIDRYRVDLLTPTPETGVNRPLGSRISRVAYGESVVWLNDLADDGRPLARATAQLVGDLLQTYGVAENQQIRRDGSLNPQAWGPHWETIKQWAQSADIPLADQG